MRSDVSSLLWREIGKECMLDLYSIPQMSWYKGTRTTDEWKHKKSPCIQKERQFNDEWAGTNHRIRRWSNCAREDEEFCVSFRWLFYPRLCIIRFCNLSRSWIYLVAFREEQAVKWSIHTSICAYCRSAALILYVWSPFGIGFYEN